MESSGTDSLYKHSRLYHSLDVSNPWPSVRWGSVSRSPLTTTIYWVVWRPGTWEYRERGPALCFSLRDFPSHADTFTMMMKCREGQNTGHDSLCYQDSEDGWLVLRQFKANWKEQRGVGYGSRIRWVRLRLVMPGEHIITTLDTHTHTHTGLICKICRFP